MFKLFSGPKRAGDNVTVAISQSIRSIYSLLCDVRANGGENSFWLPSVAVLLHPHLGK